MNGKKALRSRGIVKAVAMASLSITTVDLSAGTIDPNRSVQSQEPRFAVSSAVVEGYSIDAIEELQSVIDAALKPEMTLSDLQDVARDATSWLRIEGYSVAQVTLPSQTISSGRVVFKALPGLLDTVEMKNQSGVSDRKLQKLVDAQIQPGQPIKQPALERAFLLATDLSGTGKVRGSFSSGDRLGTSRISLDVPKQDSVTGVIGLDNYGNRYTGESRLSGSVSWNNPTGYGDSLSAALVMTEEEMYYGQVGYEMRPGTTGLTLGASLVSNQYELGEEFASLDASGESTTATLYARYPLIRQMSSNLYLSSSVGHRRLEDTVEMTGSTIEKSSNVATIGLSGDLHDRWLGGGLFNVDLSYTFGNLEFDTPYAEFLDQLGPQTAGSYGKWQATVKRLQSVGPRLMLSVELSHQGSNKNLDSSERYALGGMYGVRAYPTGEAVVDEALALNLEARYQLTSWLAASAFYNIGEGRRVHDPYTGGDNNVDLSGYGIGLEVSKDSIFAEVVAAQRLTEAAVSAPDREPRVWFGAGWRF